MAMVTILMATYNGQQFIKQQLDSIVKQNFTEWRLVIRDDGSTDDTIKIINEYTATDNRIAIIHTASVVKGACGNFSALYDWARQNVSNTYIMFCDQDDIWKLNKIEITLRAMQLLEKGNPGTPCLIYGQLEFIDADSHPVPGQIKMVEETEFRYLISYNYMYGCTMMLNEALINRMNNIPVVAENHDYWIALVGALGVVHFINQPLLQYRKHDSNVSGNVKNNSGFKQRISRHTLKSGRLVKDIQKRLCMLVLFYKTYHDQIGDQTRVMLKNYLLSFKTSRISVVLTMLKYRILRFSLLQTFSSFYLVFFFYSKIKPETIIPADL